ncbi:unconventional myosin heavy chain (macronuclear) [Tetrahymena thermophila SB210]|uniref:Unconventional myosin heavy chain n=1 Tax=Tetrahymena thermophila (strain SB210) TaxID=312017 RepID=Q22ZC8_TETTS|nr:unconventional myosin heavy chain [Tetrahymena thermophila SB210]EAR90393.2 unconventional myosin heavy chain [Tetrahymena thermophila SB210]|eukprot:XP_001010638.2 unconventional myosin heavy chain [Tetrahymena thermophila SB210]
MNKSYQEWINPNVECWVWLKYENSQQNQNNSENGQYFQCVIQSVQKEKNLAKIKVTCKEEQLGNRISDQAINGQLDVQFERLLEKEIMVDSLQTLGYSDMVHMKYLNEAEIINNLRKRYQNNMIFTYIGPTLVVMNPYKEIEGVQDNQVIDKIKSDLGIKFEEDFKMNNLSTNQNIINTPHTYTVSGLAYKQMFSNKKNQAIVISGESGAGKTENAKLSMQFLTSLSSGSDKQNDLLNQLKTQTAKNILLEEFNQFAIEVKILACNPILEAFGNAKTVRNNNSSRFGKYVKIYIDKTSQKINGASIDSYLLEKSRIPCPGKGERNYHIFYHMLKGNQELSNLRLSQFKNLSDFDYLKKSDCFEVENIQDAKLYLEVKKSFRQMNFSNQEQEAIFSLISAILLLGNANLDSSKASDTQAPTFLNMSLPTHHKEFKNASELLQVNPKDLEESLVFKVRKVGTTVIKSPQTAEECLSMRDSLSKNLYDSLFNFLVWKLNQNLLPPQDLLNKSLSIGLLDIFGFESFDINSFEQLCINFTNEKFQQLYVQYVFKSEEEDYKQEGILDVFSDLQYQENQLIIDTIEKKPNGIMVLLDENCSLGSGTDDSFLNQITKNHSKNQLVSFPKKDKYSFSLSHTAKQVVYDVRGFRDKNKDEVSTEVEKCLQSSKCPVIANLLSYQGSQTQQNKETQNLQNFGNNLNFKKAEISNQMNSSKKNVKFLGQKFRQSLQELMIELNNSDVHFIRCIKPNEEKKKNFFKYDYVYQQVQYLGILDSIKIRKVGYSYRMTYENFFLEYQELGQKTKGLTLQKVQQQKLDLKQLITTEIFEKTNLLQNKQLPQKCVAFGKTKIFLKNEVMKILHEKIQEIIQQRKKYAKRIIVSIQKYLFRKYFHKNLMKIKNQLIKLQSFARMAIQRQKFLRKKKSILKMKKLIRLRMLGQGISAFRLNYISFVWDLVCFMIFDKTNIHIAFQQIKYYRNPNKTKPVVQNQTSTIQQNKQQNQQPQKSQNQVTSSFQVNNQMMQQKQSLVGQQIQSIVNELNLGEIQINKTQQDLKDFRKSKIIPQVNLNPSHSSKRASNAWRQTLIASSSQNKINKDLQLSELGEQKLINMKETTDQKEKIKYTKPLILQFTEYNPAYQYAEFNMESAIDLEDVPNSLDFEGELNDLISEEIIQQIKKNNFYSHLSFILAKRTKWGITQTQEKIMRHQLKPISNPLTNIADLKNIITYEDTKDAVQSIRSIIQQNNLYNDTSTQTQRPINYEDARTGKLDKQVSKQITNDQSQKLATVFSKYSLMNPRKASVRDTNSLEQIVLQQRKLTKLIQYKKFSPSEKAINIFKTLLKCTGERKSRYNRHNNIIKLLTLCNEESIDLKEEVYVQLCKQLSANDKKESRIKYLKLFAIISSILPTTSRFYYPLLHFLYMRNTDTQIEQDERKWYQYCFQRIYKSEQIQRGCIPTDTEIVMIENKKQILIRVYLLNEIPITVGVESYTSVKMLKQELLQKIGITQRHEYYGLMEVRNNIKKKRKETRFIDESERVMDVIAFWENEQYLFGSQLNSSFIHSNSKQNDEGIEQFNLQNYQDLEGLKIYLGIRILFSFQENDKEAISVFYTQLSSEVLEGKYAPLEEKDYLNLAALQLCIDFPRDVILKEISKRQSINADSGSPQRTQSNFLSATSQSESGASQLKKLSYQDIEQIDEQDEYEQFIQNRNEILIDPVFYIPAKMYFQKDIQQWQHLILQNLVDNRLLKKEYTPSQAKLAYILYLSKQDLFMSTIFRDVKYQRIKIKTLNDTLSSKEKYEQMIQQNQQIPIKDEILLAINPSNILMCDSIGLNRPKRRVQIKNIQKFCCTEKEVIVISHDNTKHIFETPQYCREIAFLIRSYLRIFYQKQQQQQQQEKSQ